MVAMRPYTPQDHVMESDKPGQSMESDIPMMNNAEDARTSGSKDVTPGTKKKKEYRSLVIIMS
jgi:hypothetical protein